MWASPSDPVGAEIMQEGLAGLGTDRPDVRARVLSALALGMILSPGGSLREADEAVTAAREAGHEHALRGALGVRAWAVRGVLPAADLQRTAEDAIAAARAGNDRPLELNATYHLAAALLNRGDLEGAQATYLQSSEWRGALEGWAIADYRAAHALATGRFDEAVRLSESAHALGSALGETNDGLRALQHWNAARLTGDFATAHTWQQRCDATAIGLIVPTGPLTALDMGDEQGARALLAAWVREIEPLVPPISRYSNVGYLSPLALHLASLDGLEGYAEYAEGFPGELLGSDAGIIGAADAARGCFAAARGELDRAVALLEIGHAVHERLELHQLVVESGLDLGIVLLRRNARGDQDRATALLTTTAELAAEIGMVPSETRARNLVA